MRAEGETETLCNEHKLAAAFMEPCSRADDNKLQEDSL